MKNSILSLLFSSPLIIWSQTTSFDNLNANALTNKAITWTSSNYGNGFGHRLVNSDPGFETLLNFQGRSNSTTWTNIMSLTSDGKVGIGTIDPKAKFHVTTSDLLGENPGNYQILTRIQGRTSNNFIESTWIVRDASGNNWLTGRLHNAISIDNSYSTPNVDTKTWWERDPHNNIQSWGNSAQTYMSLINGNLGIGTTIPDSKLTVKGKIHAEEVKVDLSVPAPDYVFKDGYKLKSLEEVKSHISKYGHLSNIPSAKDMEADGVELGIMNMKLLEKIEELTLYLIEQNEQNKLQQIQIEILKSKLVQLEE
tara:strand:- start:4830 stop:5759 length:930 start_codon:yes stop_codon:yes gene_type:complete